MNRQQRRAAMRQQRKDMRRPGYNLHTDRRFHDGVNKIVRAVDFGEFNFCIQRALVAREVLRRCRINAQLQLGSMLYRVGPDPYRDVIAFCGAGNAGFNNESVASFHAWLTTDGYIIDHSVGDWVATANYHEIHCAGASYPGPVQWGIPKPPQYWWRPYAELTAPWRPTGTPEIGQAWYGPFNGDLKLVQQSVRDIQEDLGPKIVAAVAQVFARGSEMIGLPGSSYHPGPSIISTELDPPQDYQRTSLHEILRRAGLSTDGVPDVETFVTTMPSTAAEAIELLQNMTMTVPLNK
jgi:hypothetical protein